MNGQDLVGADEYDDGGFEVTVRVYKREEHQPPDLGFLEGLVVWQEFQQVYLVFDIISLAFNNGRWGDLQLLAWLKM
ncbi:hypothetical protein HanPI659440_Chr08g0308641 [Helianthus annuus]|nr:hypothetical protein HanPI659440_Chr08g0308641 [Helianthus annuus]